MVMIISDSNGKLEYRKLSKSIPAGYTFITVVETEESAIVAIKAIELKKIVRSIGLPIEFEDALCSSIMEWGVDLHKEMKSKNFKVKK